MPSWAFWLLVGIGSYAALFYLTWVHYVAVMHLKKVRDTVGLTNCARRLGVVAEVVGLILDFAVNLGTTPFVLDPPQEPLMTGRLQRYRKGKGWWSSLQKPVADKICECLLNPFDSKDGYQKDHC